MFLSYLNIYIILMLLKMPHISAKICLNLHDLWNKALISKTVDVGSTCNHIEQREQMHDGPALGSDIWTFTTNRMKLNNFPTY